MLRRAGHHVDVAPDATSAIEALRTTPYDLVLMDVFVPGLDGKEAAEAIRTLPGPGAPTPIIALTATGSPDDADAARAAGMDGVLAKPISLTDLQEVVRDHVWTPPPSLPDAGAAAENDAASAPPLVSARRFDELRAMLPTAALHNTMEECLTDMSRQLPALRRSLTARAPGAVVAHAQAMASIAAAYGMTVLGSRLQSILAAARDGDLTPARSDHRRRPRRRLRTDRQGPA